MAERAVIHRDIRSSNVLLTGALSAKVAGFGLARMADDGPDATHVTTRAMGTAGYVDPEYMVTLQLTDKSDVYSFGVLLVELMTGRPPIERRPNLEPRATTKWVRTELETIVYIICSHVVSGTGCLLTAMGCDAGDAEVQGRRRGGCHGPEDEKEPGVGGSGGGDAAAFRAVPRADEEGPAVDAAVHRGAVDRAAGLPPEAGDAAGRVCHSSRRQEHRSSGLGDNVVDIADSE
jgi:hypothetical protein